MNDRKDVKGDNNQNHKHSAHPHRQIVPATMIGSGLGIVAAEIAVAAFGPIFSDQFDYILNPAILIVFLLGLLNGYIVCAINQLLAKELAVWQVVLLSTLVVAVLPLAMIEHEPISLRLTTLILAGGLGAGLGANFGSKNAKR